MSSRPIHGNIGAERAKQELARYLSAARKKAGLNRGQLAAAVGYRNLGKGCKRVTAWEAGQQMPSAAQFENLAVALGLEQSELSEWLEATEAALRLGQRMNEQDGSALAAERTLIAEHYDILLRRADDVLEQPAWRKVTLIGAGYSIAYIGSGIFTLGELIAAWSAGQLTVDCKTCGSVFRIVAISGSPLSGSGLVTGFCRNCGANRMRPPLSIPLFMLIRPALDRLAGRQWLPQLFRKRSAPFIVTPDSPLVVLDVLAALGVDLQPIPIFRVDGSLLAEWHPKSDELRSFSDRTENTQTGLIKLGVDGPEGHVDDVVPSSLGPLWAGHSETNEGRVFATFGVPLGVRVLARLAELVV